MDFVALGADIVDEVAEDGGVGTADAMEEVDGAGVEALLCLFEGGGGIGLIVFDPVMVAPRPEDGGIVHLFGHSEAPFVAGAFRGAHIAHGGRVGKFRLDLILQIGKLLDKGLRVHGGEVGVVIGVIMRRMTSSAVST